MQKPGFRLMRQLIRQYSGLFSGALACTAATVFLGFLTPVLVAEVLDHSLGNAGSRLPAALNRLLSQAFGENRLAGSLWVFGVAIVFTSALSGVFSFYKGRLSATAAEKAASFLRSELYGHLQDLPYAWHVMADSGDLIQRCSSDVETVRRFLSVQLMAILNAVLMIGISLSLMIPIDARITLISLALIPALFVFAWLFFGMVMRAFHASDEAEARLSAVLKENLSGVRVVRAFGQASSEIEKFDRASDDFMDKAVRVSALEAAYWSLGDLLSLAQAMVTLLVCIHETIAGTITLGDMVVFTSYVGMLLWPIRQLGRILSDAGKSVVSLGRISEVLAVPAEPRGDSLLKPPLSGDIVFDRVCFHYEDGHPVLSDISFTVRRGQTVAILGATGSGKSTLVHLLLRLYEPSEGAIRIGGIPVSAIDRRHLRQRIGLILQETFLFSRSIRDNVTIAAPDASPERMKRAVRDAGAWDFIHESKKGFDTLVGERGVTLSGGQRQRIAIARMLLKDCDVLVFDDSLSAVDTLTDAQIRRSLKARRGDLTTILISHRITTLRQADLILVMEQGRITDRGTHDELVLREGLYARIHAIQRGMEDQDNGSPPAPTRPHVEEEKDGATS